MLYKIVFALVKFFFGKLKVTVRYELRQPAVFVCNHLGPFGPLAMMLYFPVPVRPWVSYRTTKRGLAAKEISDNMFKKDSKVPQWLRNLAGAVLQIPALWVMKALRAIPVYNDAVSVSDTLCESVKTLKEGVSIAVFADKEGDHIDESVREGIRGGCVYLGHFYGRGAKEPLLFYPVHISRIRREITVGEPVTYYKANGTRTEVERVTGFLSDAIQQMGSVEKKSA